MIKKQAKNESRLVRHARVRKKISGTPERPRLSVYKSLTGIYAQIIDDVNGKTLAAASAMNLCDVPCAPYLFIAYFV